MSERPLNEAERALWQKLIATVRPLRTAAKAGSPPPVPAPPEATAPPLPPRPRGRVPPLHPPAPAPPPARAELSGSLDGSWERRLKRGDLLPDLVVDLHGADLAGAYARLDFALERAWSEGLRSILLVTGRARDHDRVSREGRGAIRAAVADWLSASRHAERIAAVRQAHPRQGGAGALVIIVRRRRQPG